MDIEKLKFDEKGLIPAVVQDHYTKQVLTVAYMNRESLEITMKEGHTCFYSRSRQELWRKGETSGNTQKVVSITSDCDRDALVVEVIKNGPACHTGEESCFFNLEYIGEGMTEVIIAGAKNDREETIYEVADLAYHLMVMMVEQGITLQDVTAELTKRHVIDHKVKQERMK